MYKFEIDSKTVIDLEKVEVVKLNGAMVQNYVRMASGLEIEVPYNTCKVIVKKMDQVARRGLKVRFL